MMIEQRKTIFNSEIVEKHTKRHYKVVIDVAMWVKAEGSVVLSSTYQIGFYTEDADGKWRLSFGTADTNKDVIVKYYLNIMTRFVLGNEL